MPGSRASAGRVVSKRRVRRGRRTRIAGRLRTPDRRAIPSATVRVFGAGVLLGSTKTDKGGRFSLRVRARVSTPLLVIYSGSSVIRPVVKVLDLQVPASSTLGVSRRRVLNGQRVIFGGRLAQRAALPAGKLVELQTKLSGGWQTFRTTRTNARGTLEGALPLPPHLGTAALPLPRPPAARGRLSVRHRDHQDHHRDREGPMIQGPLQRQGGRR